MSEIQVNTINEYTGANGVTIDGVLIKDGQVDGVDVSSLGTWQDWTPTITNGTQGNGTITARYVQLGKLVIANFLFQLGSTSSITGDFNFSLPVTAANANVYGASLNLIEDGVKDIMGLPALTTTSFYCRAASSDTANVSNRSLSSNTPFTWGTGDKVIAGCYYEAS